MFKPIIAALIAATALVPPAFAQDRQRGERGQRAQDSSNQGQRQSRQEWRQSRQDSGQQPRSDWRSSRQPAQAQAPQAAPQPQPQAAPQPQRQARSWRGQDGQPNAGQPNAGQGQQQFRRDRGQWNGQNGANNGGQAQQQFRGNRGQFNGNTGVVPPQQRAQDRGRQDYRGQGQQQFRGTRGNGYQGGYANNGNNRRWSGNWRSDNRYDWRNNRSRNRSAYRLPRYYAPRGYNYGYQRFGIGITLGSMLFGQQYWIEDPFFYRLPPAYGQYRWVRYYNDALLVDIYSGEVVDVEYDIFW